MTFGPGAATFVLMLYVLAAFATMLILATFVAILLLTAFAVL
jgi:hypothetical protein